MSSVFRAFAIDYDGTLASADRANERALAAIRELRSQGRVVVLVTGRILSELRCDFPDVDDHFDAIVAENGAVLHQGPSTWTLAPPVDEVLERGLRQRGVPLRRGQVILAMDGQYAPIVYGEISRLGLEVQVVHNRGALMVLPHDVSKGSGTTACLAELGVSHHNAVGIGDAENDHSLLDACEIGVAVSDAIDALKAHADVVLTEPNGKGVAAFLKAVAANDLPRIEPTRWSIEIGSYIDGLPATVPGSRVTVAINGESGTGKSYLAGLLAERLIQKHYSVCVLDLEGDHSGLREVHGTVGLGGKDPLPPLHEVGELLRHGLDSLVIDLSMHSTEDKRTYARAVLAECQAARETTGRPHWVIVEEAHLPLAAEPDERDWFDPMQGGVCLVSYRPDLLCTEAARSASIVLTALPGGSAMFTRVPGAEQHRFTPAPRRSPHARHTKKYMGGQLPFTRRFFFRDGRSVTGRSAGNLTEFRDELLRAPVEVVRHHAAHHDFSRWLSDLSRDPELTSEVRGIERDVARSADANGVSARDQLVEAIVARYAI